MKLSARNQLAGTVVAITKGEAIAKIELEVAGLQPGTEIVAVIKASDVIIATP